MRKILKRILIVIGIAIIGYCLFTLILSILLTMGTGRIYKEELHPEEIQLFSELKTELNLEEISRTPEMKKVFEEKNEYTLYFEYLSCDISKENLNAIAKKVILRVNDKITLTNKFSSIKFIFYRTGCPPYRTEYIFLKKDIDKLKK